VPRFFDGRLPDLNFGTADGKSCSLQLQGEMMRVAESQDHFSFIFNGRFKGGHITRFYGDPAAGVHAIQLEMSQCLYMEEAPPFAYLPDVAGKVQPLLRELLDAAIAWARVGGHA
jgi:N-formylglutamate deformylase